MNHISIRERVEAAHQLKLPYASKCNKLHGHSYRIKVELESPQLNAEAMIMDFSKIRDVIRKYDHDFLNAFFEPSTAENFARVLFIEITELISRSAPPHAAIRVKRVSVRETPKNEAVVDGA